jgi:Fic family protein
MALISEKRNAILEFVKGHPLLSSKEIHERLGIEISYATVKRILQELVNDAAISAVGKGRGTKYELSPGHELLYPVDVEEYFKKEIDERKIHEGFNYELWDVLRKTPLFSPEELKHLERLQAQYQKNISQLNEAEYKKELERLAIDLSWKSSQIEGNTYSLLETEKLIKDKEEARGKTKDEAIMLLNHKEAIDFIVAHPTYVNPLRLAGMEDIHSILMKDLGIERNIRRRRVGITGTNYRPLDNEQQIREAFGEMCQLVNEEKNVFVKALLVLVLISYIQGFEDGNKRTARIISNAILMNHGYCPISFRTIDSVEYKKAMLIFYEQNNITAFKKIFISQFEFAVNNYF